MNILGKILLKAYASNTNTSIGAILGGFVALFSSSGRLYLKSGENDGDRLLTAQMQYITDSIILAKLQVESNWTRNTYNKLDIDVNEFGDVVPGQRAIIQIPSGGRYYKIEAIKIPESPHHVILRSSTSYQDTFVKDIDEETESGLITSAEHQLIPSDSYHISVYKYETGKTIKTEIGYEIFENGNVSWVAQPALPANSKIMLRL